MSGSPTITGTHATSTINGAPVEPFTGVTVSDPVDGATETLTLYALGLASNITLADGADYTGPHTLKSLYNGQYQIIGTATQVTQELDALSLTVATRYPGDIETIPITLEDSSSSNNYVFDQNTQVINSTPSDTVSLSSQVNFANGLFTLTGKAASVVGVNYVDLQAIVDGVPTDLGSTTVDADGNFTFADRVGSHTQSFITAIAIDSIDNSPPAMDTASFSLTGGLRQGFYRAEQDSYTADGSAETSTTLFRAGGGRSVDVLASGQTFSSDHSDVWNNGGTPETTFVFDPGYGHDAIRLFRVGGADHDMLNFKGSDFGADPTSQLAGVLANTHFEKGGAVITDPATQETVKLFGVSRQQLVANQQDIMFHA